MTYLEETKGIEVLPDVVDDLGPRDKDVPRRVVHDQIKISLPVPRLEVD